MASIVTERRELLRRTGFEVALDNNATNIEWLSSQIDRLEHEIRDLRDENQRLRLKILTEGITGLTV